MRQHLSIPFAHLKKFQGVSSEVFERCLLPTHGFLEIVHSVTAFDGNFKNSVVCISPRTQHHRLISLDSDISIKDLGGVEAATDFGVSCR